MALILAGSSRSRREMLEAAGVKFDIQNAHVDEEPIKDALLAEGANGHNIADALAEMKALSVSTIMPEHYVIGADQILEFDGVCFSKARNRTEAKTHLQAMSGKKHNLISAVVIARAGQSEWRAIEKVRLTMRTLSDDFIDQYLEKCGPDILSSVGCYHIEGMGAQLFDRVEGDYFTILGMPLLKVLDFCRTKGLIKK